MVEILDARDIPFSQVKPFIYSNYIEKLVQFLRGRAMRVATSTEYMKVY